MSACWSGVGQKGYMRPRNCQRRERSPSMRQEQRWRSSRYGLPAARLAGVGNDVGPWALGGDAVVSADETHQACEVEAALVGRARWRQAHAADA